MSALDKDFGINSQLQYFILSGNNGPFSITLNGTFQILHSLDREAQPKYFVTIVAIDLGDLNQAKHVINITLISHILFCKDFAARLQII